jgi:hypothetical protein
MFFHNTQPYQKLQPELKEETSVTDYIIKKARFTAGFSNSG